MSLGDGVAEGIEPVGTSGYANNGGFRVPLLEMAVEDGRFIEFVGARESGPSAAVQEGANPQRHSGFAAIRLGQLDAMVPNPLKNYFHDIVLLHVGTFEGASTVVDGHQPEKFEPVMLNLTSILEDLYEINPKGLIVVSNLVDRALVRSQSASLSTAIEQTVERFKGQNPAALVEIADHYSREIPKGHDNFMPNAAGYRVIAEAWYEAIEHHLN